MKNEKSTGQVERPKHMIPNRGSSGQAQRPIQPHRPAVLVAGPAVIYSCLPSPVLLLNLSWIFRFFLLVLVNTRNPEITHLIFVHPSILFR